MKKAQINSNEDQTKKSNKKAATTSVKPRAARESLKEFKERMKKNAQKSDDKIELFGMEDFYAKSTNSISSIKKGTGICFDDFMSLHKCIWDPEYSEGPQRYFAVINRLKELDLIERCERLKPKQIKRENIARVHHKDLYLRLKEICDIRNSLELEKKASEYDSVYFNEHTFEAALYAAGCCLVIAENVCKGAIKNGFAVVRPPGHHAMYNEFSGYCYFNNVAITAQHLLDQNLAQRILIIDFDVHHGQGTQQTFYNDNRVLYFSIHRYENGTFWPNLRESNFDFVGDGNGRGYNINVPLNETGLGDDDYLAIVLQILLPVAYEFQPNLIIVSAGFDSAIGDEKGMMLTTPAFYAHLIFLLSGLAEGKIVVCLEGGYFLPSLAEGAAMTLRSLLGDPPPTLAPTKKPKDSTIDVINNIKFVLKSYWNCFRPFEVVSTAGEGAEVHKVCVEHLDAPPVPPYPTRACYPVAEEGYNVKYTEAVEKLKEEYGCKYNQGVCYCYDDEMLLHKTKREDGYEEPIRLRTLYERFKEFGLDSRCKRIDVKLADLEVLQKTHGNEYAKNIVEGAFKEVNMSKRDIYTCDDSTKSILKSAGGLLSVIDEVMAAESSSGCGAAFIRPPGHHADHGKAMGFCFINNVAVAANYVLDKYKLQRVLIVDFDIHHGNGTQSLFYDNPKVLYLSVHKYDNGNYFPQSEDANFDRVGRYAGEGFNVNIPLNKEKHGNSEYLAIFHRIILPIAYSFSPELVLVSAGFDAGIHDPLGHYKVTPEAFGHFIQLLHPLARGRTVLALEGGYNPTTLAFSMVMCVKALLGDPLPPLDKTDLINGSAQASIEDVIRVQKEYWPVLGVDKKLPNYVEYLKVFDGVETLEIRRPDPRLLNCGVEELKKRLRREQDRGDMDSVVEKLEKVTL
ncbi:histone deacetylase 6 isoform X2 [Agrilus planipennis]|uniref:Histone deacetylase 6 isoform X2 n=1 Tax=Agrilus planipennis TaxID=224129 RepID=A0A1W4WI46_AGRPL|nr:histone deacetylase 6 isoform X2 [Agrilus planipennis]